MPQVTVRITQTWEILVDAEYGDTDETLVEKAVITDAPDAEHRVLLVGKYISESAEV